MYGHLNEDRIAAMVNEAVGNLQEKTDLEGLIRQVVERLLAGLEERLIAEIRSSQEVILSALQSAGIRPEDQP